MRFIGVDLAAQPKNTSLCVLEWKRNPRVVSIHRPATDDQIINESHGVAAIGIDSPFGWPISFAKFILKKQVSRDFLPINPSEANHLKYRFTDDYVRKHFDSLGKNVKPLSVSTDKLGVVALRCVRLCQCLAAKYGDEFKIFEIYPAASLASWMTVKGSYKSSTNPSISRENRIYIVEELEKHGVDMSIRKDSFVNSDDDLDALLCALTCAVAFKEKTFLSPADMSKLTEFEGWIHFPCGSLEDFSRITFLS